MNVPSVVKLVHRHTTIKNKEIIISNVAEVGLEAQPLAKNNELTRVGFESTFPDLQRRSVPLVMPHCQKSRLDRGCLKYG